MASSNQVCLAVDIESMGAVLGSHIIAIGFCLGDADGNVIEKKSFYITPPPDATFEPRCKEQFWDKHPGLFESFLAKSIDAGIAYQEIGKYLSSLEKYERVTILSDNPAFDLAHLDVALKRYLGRIGIRYSDDSTGNKYRWVADYSERAYIIGVSGEVDKLAMELAGLSEKDLHEPSNDALLIYYGTVITQRIRNVHSERFRQLALEVIATFELVNVSK